LASTEELVEVEEEVESDEEELRIIGPTPGGMQRRGGGARGGRRRRAQVVLSDDDDDDDDDGAYRRAGPEVSPACWSSDGREQTEEAEEEDEEDSDARRTSTSGTGTTAADTDSTFDAPSSGSEDVGASTGSSSSSSAATTASEEDDDDVGEPDGTPAATGGKKKNNKDAASPAAAAAHEDGPGGLAFARRRERLARELYAEWNALVFDGRLPTDLPIVWNPRLRCTAGQVVDDRSRDALKIGATPAARRAERVACRLELSPRVLDRESRLRDTLAHEMAHVAAWTIDRDYERAHGPTFQRWARLFERALQGGVTITTRHGYGPSVPQRRWVCSSEACGCVYSRSKLSIDVRRHVCGLCRGKLLYQGRFTADGQLLEAGPAAPASAAAAAASAAKPKRPLNAFGQFVQAEYAATKKSMGGGGAKHAAVMAVLSARWKESKAKAAEAEAEAAEATHLEEEEEEEEQSLALVGVQLEELRVW
jgi:predicted SprT family Zn-dependent metalloprotease